MDRKLYITHLSDKATESELNSWLQTQLETQCSTSLKRGKIQGTQIAFATIGNVDVDRAITILNNTDFLGSRIRVMRYVQTDKNRRFTNESGPSGGTSIANIYGGGPREQAGNCGPSNSTRSSLDNSHVTAQPPVSRTGALVFVTSASHFYVQEISDLPTLKIVNSYMELLDEKAMTERSGTVDISIGNVCAARYALDNKYYRARILSKENKGQIEVQFVDFGNTETVALESLVSLPVDIAKQDYVAKRCCFHKLTILDEEKAANFLREAGEQFNVVFYLETPSKGGFRSWEVDLLREGPGESLRQELIKLGLGRLEVKAEPTSDAKASPSDEPQAGAARELLSSATCIISHVESCERFFLQGAYGQSHLAEIYQCLLSAASLPQINVADVSPSRIYAAMFSKDGTWYRCRLRDLAPGNKERGSTPTVYFIDFGNSEMLSSDVRVLPEEIAQIPPQAALCQLPDLRISNPVKVKNDLIALGNNEVPLKCHLTQTPGSDAISVDFGVEGQYRSFCSWIIENRCAERIYKHNAKPSPPVTSNSSPRFVPPQVSRRQTVEPPAQSASAVMNGARNKRPGPKAKSTSANAPNWSPRSPRSPGTDSGNDDRRSEMLRNEFIDAITFRKTLDNWRNALCQGEGSLVRKLSRLRQLKSEGNGEGGAGGDIAAYQELVALRNDAGRMREALVKAKEDVKTALKDSSKEDALCLAAQRDELANQLADCLDKFLAAVASRDDLLQKCCQDAESVVKKVDFLIKQCSIRKVAPSDVNGHADSDEQCEKIWSDYESSPFFEQRLSETEHCATQLEEVREVFGEITGVSPPKEHDSAAIVTSLFEKLKTLNNAMSQEVNAYNVHFLSGPNGELMCGYLERHLALARDFKEDVKKLEQDCELVREWKNEATVLLQGLEVLTNGTIESLEEMAGQRKKAKSKLRHIIADLEDEEEGMNNDSDRLASLRESIAEIRCELHTILDREINVKKAIYDSLELRPELAVQVKENLKIDPALMDHTGLISSWETYFFDLVPVKTEGNNLFCSKFKNEDVFIQKVLLTNDNLSSLEESLVRYQQVARAPSSSLAPLLAAFVPPRDSHVLYLVTSGHALMRDFSTNENAQKAAHAMLRALYNLRTKKLLFSLVKPMQIINEPEPLVLPNFGELEESDEKHDWGTEGPSDDLQGVLDAIEESMYRCPSGGSLERTIEKIYSTADYIPDALSRIESMMSDTSARVQKEAKAALKVVSEDGDAELKEEAEDGLPNGKGGETKEDLHLTAVVVVEKQSDANCSS